MIVVLTGGTGGAKFIDGLRQVVPPEDITIIVNTGDDLEWWGLYVSPDLDSITCVLAGLLSKERGWGVKGDTFYCLQAMGELGQPIWFHVGDRDLAVHLLRSKLLTQGKTLAEATNASADSRHQSDYCCRSRLRPSRNFDGREWTARINRRCGTGLSGFPEDSCR